MTTTLRVHPSFFREFATKTWVSPSEIIKELVENAFDEDATKVLITITSNNSISIEDDAGMDSEAIQKFLILGSPHKTLDSISPRLKRLRTGRYGTGRLSFLTTFERMKIRTKRGNFSKSFIIDYKSLDNLSSGDSELEELNEKELKRDGTELTISGSNFKIDEIRLIKELKKLAILRQPLFEVFIKKSEDFREWDFSAAQIIKVPDIQGHKIPVNINQNKIVGEIVIAKRPLSEDEKGIAVMIGNHIVMRTLFGFDPKLARVTGFIRCDELTSRFADKSAIIEDEKFEDFNVNMKKFILEIVIPSLAEYEDVLITREESKIYKQIDKVLGQAVVQTLEAHEEIEGYEIVDTRDSPVNSKSTSFTLTEENPPNQIIEIQNEYSEMQNVLRDRTGSLDPVSSTDGLEDYNVKDSSGNIAFNTSSLDSIGGENKNSKIRRPILKKTFALKRVGYKVIPYDDDSDSRYSFINENVVFVNKANPTYKAESARGDEFLLRHIMNIVAQAVAETRFPEGKEALELQNRLISEAIRLHDKFVSKSL